MTINIKLLKATTDDKESPVVEVDDTFNIDGADCQAIQLNNSQILFADGPGTGGDRVLLLRSRALGTNTGSDTAESADGDAFVDKDDVDDYGTNEPGSVMLSADRLMAHGEDQYVLLTGDRRVHVDGKHVLAVGEDQTVIIGAGETREVTEDQAITVDGTYGLDAGGEITSAFGYSAPTYDDSSKTRTDPDGTTVKQNNDGTATRTELSEVVTTFNAVITADDDQTDEDETVRGTVRKEPEGITVTQPAPGHSGKPKSYQVVCSGCGFKAVYDPDVSDEGTRE